MNDYEMKQESKRERLEQASRAAFDRANAAGARVHAIGGRFEFGQPILVGHHSEAKARRDRQRMDENMRRSINEQKSGADLARRAAAVGTGGISSDDQDAITKLEAELAKHEKEQTSYKAINATIRKHAKHGADAQVAALLALGIGIKESSARAALVPDFAGRVGIAAYVITNNGANIRRIEKRIAELRAKASTPARDPIETDRYTIAEEVDENRCRITFPTRQPAPVVAALKTGGFRWAPSIGAWQRQRSNGAWAAALRVAAVVDAQQVAASEPAPAEWIDALDL